MKIIQQICNSMYEIRSEKVLLDFDLAVLFDISGNSFRQAVQQHIRRFPPDFMFRLSKEEWQAVCSSGYLLFRPANRILFPDGAKKRRMRRRLPYAFTAQGAAMLSGVVHGRRAVTMHILILRAFAETYRLQKYDNSASGLPELKQRVDELELQLAEVSAAMEELPARRAAQRRWEERERIGFKKE